jgi:tRNA threonylcarbamoyladenosine biosynthesis protein TsaE
LTLGALFPYHAPVQSVTEWISRDPESTIELGRRIGERLPPGSVLSLEGVLGSGKTTLVKGIALALAIEEAVTSPTFTLISRYRGRRCGRELELVHIDLYRIDRQWELEDLGLEELVGGEAISVIEWGEKARAFLPPEALTLRLDLEADGSRRLKMEGLEL